MRIVFFGCGDYARPSLRALVEGGFSPELVVTKPDAPRGRGRKIYPAEVRLEAEALELDYEQPEDVHAPEFLERLWTRFGIIVGGRETDSHTDHGLLSEKGIHVSHEELIMNAEDLIDQLVQIGLARRYPDNIAYVGHYNV